MEIDPCNNGGQELPQSLSASWRARNGDTIIQSPELLSLEPKSSETTNFATWGRREDACLSYRRKKRIHTSSTFCSILAFYRLHDVHPHWWGWSLYSNANHFGKHSQKHTHDALASIWAHLGQSSWHTKSTILTSKLFLFFPLPPSDYLSLGWVS